MMQNDSRQMKMELCVVIKAVIMMPFLSFEYYQRSKGRKAEEPQQVSAAPCSSDASWIITTITLNVPFEEANFILELL